MPSHKSTRPLQLRQSTSFLTGTLLSVTLLAGLLAGCDSRREEQPPPAPSANLQEKTGQTQAPPAPPLTETFDKAPQLSLFPRVGAFRPEAEDSQGLAFWDTYIDHLIRTSGVAAGAGRGGGNAWAFKSISGLDSVAFFSPLAVKPQTAYRVSFAFRGELPKGATAGIGLLEFDEFLWIDEQFPQTLIQKHQSGAHEGLRLSGKREWDEHTFTFTTSPKTHMVHLIIFREGTEDRKKPVLFDDIRIEEAGAG